MNIEFIRTRWAAVGAAVAISLGAGGIGITHATTSSGPRAIYTPINPCRLADLRPAPNTVGPRTAGLGPDETYTLDGWGTVGACNLPTGTAGLALNVTAVGPTAATYLRLWPADGTQPTTSNLNPTPGQPPTPNAVNVGLSAAGKFSVFNKFGTVAVIIDVVGVYDDHNHDDRYYTKSQTDQRSKWISIDPLAVNYRSGASVGTGFGANTGLLLPGGPADLPAFEFGFSMPPDYATGTDVTVELLWHINQTGCTVNIASNYASIDHYGATPASTSFGFRATDPVPGTANQVARTTFTVRSASLAPGDSVITGLFRSFNNDTCDQTLHIKGIRIRYG